MRAVALVTAMVAAAAKAHAQDNMNGDYILSQTPGARGTQEKFPTEYKDYPRPIEYFDVYSPPISQLYSQVFWKGLDPVDLPADVVERYKGKGMAVVGYEVDQVRKTDQGDVSVPINVVYNHHFESAMTGAGAHFEKRTGPPGPEELEAMQGHGLPLERYVVVEDQNAEASGLPTHQSFGGANGGEYRKSFHGYAPGFAQVIESPTQFQITPMQIDTWNRDHMNLTGPTKFVPGPVPRNSWAPTSGPDAKYSGLLECPVTTRIRKVVQQAYVVRSAGTCDDGTIATAAECFAAAEAIIGDPEDAGRKFNATAGSDPLRPQGCTVSTSATDAETVNIFFNVVPKSESTPAPVCGHGTHSVAGLTQSLVRVHVAMSGDDTEGFVDITLTGPENVWFGVGFNASAMADSPWAIIVDGSGNVTERKLQDQNPGQLLKPSVAVVSSKVSQGNRTVVLRRPRRGLSDDYFSFASAGDEVLPFINAIGSGPKLSYHKDKTPSTLSILPVAGSGVAGACVCASQPAPFGQGKGKLMYVQTSQAADTGSGTIEFGNYCAPRPRTDLLAMKNPTCDVRTYLGGQTACHHMFSLLDADQEIPWADQPVEYHLKFRFWVQPYNASYHTNVKRVTWGIASPVEFDVPKCAEGVMGCSRGPDGTWVHTITGTYTGGGKLVHAAFHCHAPTCLSLAMYRCPIDAEVCNSTTGKLLCREDPVYGGTGQVDNKNMDEPGYILQPPCLWGDEEFGLEPPPETTGYILHSVKTSNATYGHHGEMAWQQMYVI